MLFRVAEYCAWSSPTPLHSTESYRRWGRRVKIFGENVGAGFWVKQREGRHGFLGGGGEMGTGGKAVSEGWRGRWACFGLWGLRYRDAKGKGWSLERAGIEGRKMAFRGGEGRVEKVA